MFEFKMTDRIKNYMRMNFAKMDQSVREQNLGEDQIISMDHDAD